MQVTSEQTNACTIVLDIAIDEQQVARTFDSVYKEFSKHVNVPGFRPGKAPRPILEKYVNKDKVQERTLEKLITDSYFQAIEEEGITPYRQPSIEPQPIVDKQPYSFKATVPLAPVVTLGTYTGITVEKPIFTITEDVIDNKIHEMREEKSRLERVTDRGVEPGDVLIAENHIVIEGEENNDTPRRQLIQVGNNVPGFDEAILGMTPDEERTFDLTYPEDYDEEDKRGKKATYTVKLSSISAKRLPELDDAFVKSVSDAKTVEELRELVKDSMKFQGARLSDQIAEQRIIEQIVNQGDIQFPDALVGDEVQDDFRRLGEELKHHEVDYQSFLAQKGLTAEQHLEAVRQQAEARVRTVLALQMIAETEGLQATNEEIDSEFDNLLNAGKITEDQYDEYKLNERRRIQVANAIVQQRLHDFLFANNTLVEVVQSAGPDPEALAEANAEEEPVLEAE